MGYSKLVAGGCERNSLWRLSLLSICLLTPHIGVTQITFGSPMDYPVGTTPGAVATGDFNNDGKLDLAVANAASNNISILLGKGDGTFQTTMNYAVGQDPVSIAVVDLNLDNKLDLAVADRKSVV